MGRALAAEEEMAVLQMETVLVVLAALEELMQIGRLVTFFKIHMEP
jgi:hypothetical protein